MLEVRYNNETKSLTIKSGGFKIENGEQYGEMWDLLGDFDIVQANEIKQDYLAFEGAVYELNDSDISKLSSTGGVVLEYLGTVEELADENFINWYYNLN